MANYYVDPAATGAADGSSWTDAWTTLQTAADTAVAGDTVYCRGTQTLAAAIDFDTNSGTDAAGYIKFIGCNASGENDGTYFVLDGNSTAANAIVYSVAMVWLENIKIQNCTSHGINSSAFADYWNLINVWCHSNGGYGLNSGNYARYWRMFRCAFTSNTTGGIYRLREGVLFACRFADQSYGLNDISGGEIIGCVFNAHRYALRLTLAGDNVISNCVFHDNSIYGLYEGTSRSLIVGCRFSENNIGYDTPATAGRGLVVGCYFGGNTTDLDGTRYDVAPIDGSTSHVVTGGTDTDDGYVSSATGDFNLDGDTASLFSEAITIP